MPAVVPEMHTTVFICEPECGTAYQTVDYLTDKGFIVHCIEESQQAIDQIITHVPDIVVLDTHLPEAGGYEVCSAVRLYYSGRIVLQGRERDETAQLLAFERGADDYIVTPISPALLTARIRAHLKHAHGLAANGTNHQIQVRDLLVDAARREVFLAGEHVDLTSIQFELLWYLAKRSGRVVSRDELYEALYNEKYNGFDRSVDVYVSRIRTQLGDDAGNPSYLKTVRGVGYLFVGGVGQAG